MPPTFVLALSSSLLPPSSIKRRPPPLYLSNNSLSLSLSHTHTHTHPTQGIERRSFEHVPSSVRVLWRGAGRSLTVWLILGLLAICSVGLHMLPTYMCAYICSLGQTLCTRIHVRTHAWRLPVYTHACVCMHCAHLHVCACIVHIHVCACIVHIHVCLQASHLPICSFIIHHVYERMRANLCARARAYMHASTCPFDVLYVHMDVRICTVG